MTAPWYEDGLRFRCTMCGKCCTGTTGYVWVDDAELTAIAEFMGETPTRTEKVYIHKAHRGLTLREKVNGDCVFYDREQGCTIYAVRPRQCRTWPFWESNVASREAWERTCQVCPGSGQGELISPEEITRRVREIRL